MIKDHELRDQLDAEREHHKQAEIAATELARQLAAEREVGHNQAVTLGQHIARLEDQLAAERERVKHLFNLYLWTDEELKELKAKVK